jgi:hypothetical protein
MSGNNGTKRARLAFPFAGEDTGARDNHYLEATLKEYRAALAASEAENAQLRATHARELAALRGPAEKLRTALADPATIEHVRGRSWIDSTREHGLCNLPMAEDGSGFCVDCPS